LETSLSELKETRRLVDMAVDLGGFEMFPRRIISLRKRPRTSSLLALDSSNGIKRARQRVSVGEFRTEASVTTKALPAQRFTILLKASSPPPRSLRKDAILNNLRRQGWAVPVPPLSLEAEKSNSGGKALTLRVKTDDLDKKFQNNGNEMPSRRTPPPSPLGLSNYHALDDWSGYNDEFDQDDHEESSKNTMDWSTMEGDDEDEDVYSDFNFLDSDPSEGSTEEKYDDPFSVLPTELTPPTTPVESPPRRRSSTSTTCSPNWCSSPVSCQICV
jgi:hypothetical protein